MASSVAARFNADLIDANYHQWRKDPESVDPSWSAFFEGFELGSAAPVANGADSHGAGAGAALQTRVDGLVYAYRTLGHTIAQIDPLARTRPENPLLSLRELGFSEKDLDLLASSKFYLGGQRMKLRAMIAGLEKIYCGPIGVEFMHIQNPWVRNWVREKMETRPDSFGVSANAQRRMLRQLRSVEGFEHFLHTRFVGQKRFSIEGSESLIVALYALLESCQIRNVEEIALGMAHRGRLSVIREFLGKSIGAMFAEFTENYLPDTVAGDGDVKYHLGYKTVRKLADGYEVEIRLAANPSHLEAVDPVVQGMARARQRVRNDTEQRSKVLPVLIHGDAAIAGQGVVAETLNMSQLSGYRVGGTIHIVVNNQIGFTTLPADARSSRYCTDVAKMIEAPVFHVNGDNPDAVRFCAELALEFRQQFKSDVFVDMYCYRRYGHNESDEPLFTQPVMYAEIETHPSVGSLYEKRLLGSGILSAEEAQALSKDLEQGYQAALDEVKEAEANKSLDRFAGSNAIFQPPFSHSPVETAISEETLDKVCAGLTTVPESFHIVPRLKKFFLEKRVKAWKAGGPFDWSYAESLAFGSLLLEGTPVRLSGQDSRRGTFSQRHSVLYDETTRARYIPLQNLAQEQGRFCVYNSLLSESAVLGFDYGYSSSFPEMLCLWEAQFGDFSNGAQVIIDQFIVSAESKWQRPSGIVLLLPHGYEGQGPEHSSARLERFLQLCAEDNIQVCNLTTPAQYFHALRRQMKRPFRKPLVLMTPKSLLRYEGCVSTAGDFTTGRFHEILPTPPLGESKGVQRVIFCCGKVYYDLLKYRDSAKRADTGIVRLEQLYPLDEGQLKAAAAAYPNAKTFVWCQEESQNMGAWSFIGWQLRRIFEPHLIWYAGRNASASPAVGAKAIHDLEQAQVIQDAFTLG